MIQRKVIFARHQHQRPAGLGDESLQKQPGLFRHVGGGDIADNHQIRIGERRMGQVIRVLGQPQFAGKPRVFQNPDVGLMKHDLFHVFAADAFIAVERIREIAELPAGFALGDQARGLCHPRSSKRIGGSCCPGGFRLLRV